MILWKICRSFAITPPVERYHIQNGRKCEKHLSLLNRTFGKELRKLQKIRTDFVFPFPNRMFQVRTVHSKYHVLYLNPMFRLYFPHLFIGSSPLSPSLTQSPLPRGKKKEQKGCHSVVEQHGRRGIDVGEHADCRRFHAPFHASCTVYGVENIRRRM